MTPFVPSELPSPRSDQGQSRHSGRSSGGNSRLPSPGLFEALMEGSLSSPRGRWDSWDLWKYSCKNWEA